MGLQSVKLKLQLFYVQAVAGYIQCYVMGESASVTPQVNLFIRSARDSPPDL